MSYAPDPVKVRTPAPEPQRRLPPPTTPRVRRRSNGSFELAVVLLLATIVFCIFAWKGLLWA